MQNQPILSPTPVNTGRQFEVDIVKAVAIVTMVLIHLFEVMPFARAMYEAGGTAMLVILEFCGGPLSAPLFMTAMGIGLAYARQQTPGALARRGLALIGQGYVLNVLRAGLPYLIAYDVTRDAALLPELVQTLIVLDILQFAGLAFLFFALMRRVGAGTGAMVLCTAGLLGIASVARPFVEGSLVLTGVVGAFLYQSLETAFPLFSWLAYPVAGYCFGQVLRRAQDKGRLYARLLGGSAAFFVAYSAVVTLLGGHVADFFLTEVYYGQNALVVLWVLPICGMAYGALYFASLGLGRWRGLFAFMGSKVNDIYIAQWIIIGWLAILVLPLVSVGYAGYFALVAAVLAASVGAAWAKGKVY